MPHIPPVIWGAIATLVVWIASYFFGADQVGAWASTAVTVALALLKAWQEFVSDPNTVSTRGAEQRHGFLRRVFLG